MTASRETSITAPSRICNTGKSCGPMSSRNWPAAFARAISSATTGAMRARIGAIPSRRRSTERISSLQSAVGLLQLEHARERRHDALPWIGHRQTGDRDRLELGKALLEERLDQDLLVGEAPVDGSDADARVARDVVEGHLEPARGEELARGVHDAPPVSLGVGAEGTFADRHVNIVAKWIDKFHLFARLCTTGCTSST